MKMVSVLHQLVIAVIGYYPLNILESSAVFWWVTKIEPDPRGWGTPGHFFSAPPHLGGCCMILVPSLRIVWGTSNTHCGALFCTLCGSSCPSGVSSAWGMWWRANFEWGDLDWYTSSYDSLSVFSPNAPCTPPPHIHGLALMAQNIFSLFCKMQS